MGTNWVLHWASWVTTSVALVLMQSQLQLNGSVAKVWSSDAWRYTVVASIAGMVSMAFQGLMLLTSVNFVTASLALARCNVLAQELPVAEVLVRADTLYLDKISTIITGRIRLGEIQGPDGSEAPPEMPLAFALLSMVGEANATVDIIREGLADPEWLGVQGL